MPRRDNIHREPYIVEAVKQEFFNNPAFGDTKAERIDRLFTGGLTITTTIDPELQDTAERLVRQHFPNRDGVTAAIATVDPRDGRVLAAAFGREFDREQFNLALQGRRQPGSAFKPFVMTAALERGLPPDLPVEGRNRTRMGHDVLEDDETWVTKGVRNYADRSYSGLDMTEALQRSVNTAFAQLGLLVGIDRVQDVTDRLGISERAYQNRNGRVLSNPSISLGGLERGVSPLEMASAYGVFAAGGERVQPHVIAEVKDRHGEVIYEADHAAEEAVEPAIAAEMREAMRGVVTGGTGTAAAIEGWPVAGKTGTTQRNRDVWFVGYTPVLSTAVWVGHPSEDVQLRGMSSSGTAAPLWADFMRRALRDREPTDYPEPDEGELDGDVDEEVEIPSVRGVGASEAVSTLTSAGLVAQTTSTYSDAVAEGVVVWQSPNPGGTADFGSTVHLGVSVGPAPDTEDEDGGDGEGEDESSDDGDEGSDGEEGSEGDNEGTDDGGGEDERGPPEHAEGRGGQDDEEGG
jgi:penicillin-binding protein 1A